MPALGNPTSATENISTDSALDLKPRIIRSILTGSSFLLLEETLIPTLIALAISSYLGKHVYMYVFLEADLDDLAEKLRHHTATTTRIEMAPWAKAYTVDIKDIYTELSLRKIENQPTGPECKRIEDYKELFAERGNEFKEEESRPSPRPIVIVCP